MPSLASLVAAHRAVLVLDSASAEVQVGLARPGADSIWKSSRQEPGIAVFACAEAVLAEAGLGIADVGACVFCEGPGSILGVRTAAVALRTWQAVFGHPLPAFGYRSLDLVAHALAASGRPLPFAVIADARRDSWHFVEARSIADVQPLRRLPAGELGAWPGELVMPDGFRVWTPPPRPVAPVPYGLADLWGRQAGAELLRAAPAPDAFSYEDSAYVTWTPRIHRAPVKPAHARADA